MGHHSQCNLFRIMCGKLSAQKAVILSTFRLPEPRLSPYLRGDIYVGSSVFRLEYIWILCFGADLQASDVMCCARLAGESSDAAEVHWVSRCGHTATGKIFSFFIPPFLLSAFNSSFMGAEESSYHRAAPRAKNEIGRGGGEREAGSGRWGVRVFVWHRERETDGERGREEAVCSFHLLISFPGGSIIGWTIAGN